MSGLEKIVSEIIAQARAEADGILSQAREQAQQILADFEKDSAQATDRIQQEATEKAVAIEAAAQSEIELRRRHRILKIKQALLAQTLDSALEQLYNLPPEGYFELLIKIVTSNAESGEGVMFLSSKDLARMPDNFAERLATYLPVGAHLSVSSQSVGIDGGAILRYGNIDKNCSFKAIFDARRDEFTDKANEILFG